MNRWKALFLGAALCLVWMPLRSGDFGITYDESIHNEHGQMLLDYFRGRPSLADKDLAPHDGPWVHPSVYGGLFDLICQAVYQAAPVLGEYETRHLINSLFGVLLIISTGLIAKELAGWRAGLLALLFAALSPRIVGSSMNNPKDLPFAALYVFGLYQLTCWQGELPRIRPRRALLLIAAIALAMDIRVAALLLIFYLGLVTLLRLPRPWFQRPNARTLALAASIGIAGYLASAILWPWAHHRPFTAPFVSLKLSTYFAYHEPLGLFAGRWVSRKDTPWHYLLTWSWITLPLFANIGVVALPWLWQRKPRQVALLSFAVFFPLLYAIASRATVYDDGRHLLFVIPPLLALCALAWDQLFLALSTMTAKRLSAVLLALCLIEPLAFMIRNHPQEAFYFSPVIGGIRGAFKRYEIDYWGGSLRAAAEWIMGNVAPKQDGTPTRVRVYYGERTSTEYYLNRNPAFRYVLAHEETADWDYEIVLPAEAKHRRSLLDNWPPRGTVHEITADGVPLNAIVRNPLLDRSRVSLAEEDVQRAPVAGNYVNLSAAYYLEGRFAEALQAAQKAVQLNPNSARAYNNICVARAALHDRAGAVEACTKALQLEPGLQSAKTILELAKQPHAQ